MLIRVPPGAGLATPMVRMVARVMEAVQPASTSRTRVVLGERVLPQVAEHREGQRHQEMVAGLRSTHWEDQMGILPNMVGPRVRTDPEGDLGMVEDPDSMDPVPLTAHNRVGCHLGEEAPLLEGLEILREDQGVALVVLEETLEDQGMVLEGEEEDPADQEMEGPLEVVPIEGIVCLVLEVAQS